ARRAWRRTRASCRFPAQATRSRSLSRHAERARPPAPRSRRAERPRTAAASAARRARSTGRSGLGELLPRDLLLRIDERPLDDDRGGPLARSLHLELGSELRELDRHHRVADVLLEPRRVAGRRHVADVLPVLSHREDIDHRAVVVGTEARAADLHADELPGDSLLLDPSQRLLADEVRLLVEIDHPLVAQVDLVGIRVQPHVAAVREDAALDAADVAGTDHGEAVR